MSFRVEVTRVRPPMIRMRAEHPKRFQQRLQRQKYVIWASAKDIRHHPTAPRIEGMPEPPLVLIQAYARRKLERKQARERIKKD